MDKQCAKCGKLKSHSEFSKRKASKDGLQPNCKSCNKVINDEWRENNPRYWNYEDGYFSDKSKWQYITRYQKADKTIKCYELTVGDAYYIGVTKSHLHVRMNLHINQFRAQTHGKHYAKKRSLPKLWEATKHMSEDEFLEVIKNAKIIEETTGSRSKMYSVEKRWIRRYQKQGKKLLNIIHNKK